MPKPVPGHPYREASAFDRLMLLIAAVVQSSAKPRSHDEQEPSSPAANVVLEDLRTQMQELAQAAGKEIRNYSVHTLRKDLETMRRYGILEQTPYRSGYFLGTGIFNWSELQIVISSLHSQVKFQRNPFAKRIYDRLQRYLRGHQQEQHCLYPTWAHLNFTGVCYDPETWLDAIDSEYTLLMQMDTVSQAISQGQALCLYRIRSAPGPQIHREITVWPLQILYYQHSWYLLYETCEKPYFCIERFDHFTEKCQVIAHRNQTLAMQHERLAKAYQLLQAGWGLNLGSFDEQQEELLGRIESVNISVRFYKKAILAVLEQGKLHHTQRTKSGSCSRDDGFAYLDFFVSLPPRSLPEFSQWIYQFTGYVQILTPASLAMEYRSLLEKSLSFYSNAFNAQQPLAC